MYCVVVVVILFYRRRLPSLGPGVTEAPTSILPPSGGDRTPPSTGKADRLRGNFNKQLPLNNNLQKQVKNIARLGKTPFSRVYFFLHLYSVKHLAMKPSSAQEYVV